MLVQFLSHFSENVTFFVLATMTFAYTVLFFFMSEFTSSKVLPSLSTSFVISLYSSTVPSALFGSYLYSTVLFPFFRPKSVHSLSKSASVMSPLFTSLTILNFSCVAPWLLLPPSCSPFITTAPPAITATPTTATRPFTHIGIFPVSRFARFTLRLFVSEELSSL